MVSSVKTDYYVYNSSDATSDVCFSAMGLCEMMEKEEVFIPFVPPNRDWRNETISEAESFFSGVLLRESSNMQ